MKKHIAKRLIQIANKLAGGSTKTNFRDVCEENLEEIYLQNYVDFIKETLEQMKSPLEEYIQLYDWVPYEHNEPFHNDEKVALLHVMNAIEMLIPRDVLKNNISNLRHQN